MQGKFVRYTEERRWQIFWFLFGFIIAIIIAGTPVFNYVDPCSRFLSLPSLPAGWPSWLNATAVSPLSQALKTVECSKSLMTQPSSQFFDPIASWSKALFILFTLAVGTGQAYVCLYNWIKSFRREMAKE
jgi:hypothetical protein